MSTPPLGMMTVPHWEWWLHHNPFQRSYGEGGRSSCPICQSDTGCFGDCPQREIQNKFGEVVALMRKWDEERPARHKAFMERSNKPTCKPSGFAGMDGHVWDDGACRCQCGSVTGHPWEPVK